ncbi:MAG: T9SS type A sorting domain-containing protein [candidate division Zixibacteria bacterium]|nr:T9SS type A sorting domain-containing protein [candidate division Zixibacteria bacterium]
MSKRIILFFFTFLVLLPSFVFSSPLPPSSLTAVSDRDACAPLFWFEPEAQVKTIAYENGLDLSMIVECNWYNQSAGIKFSSSVTPFLVHKVKIFVSHQFSDCGNYDRTAPFHITLNRDKNNSPGDTIFGPITCQATQALSDSGEWVEVEINQISEEKTFWVMVHWLEANPSSPALGVDFGVDSLRSIYGYKKNGYQEWLHPSDFNFRIRANIIDEHQAYSQADSFRIYRSEDSNTVIAPISIIASLSNNIFQYVDSNLSNGQAYFYKLTSLKDAVESSSSNLAIVTPRLPASLDCFPDSLFSHLVPNDTEYVTLHLTNSGGLGLDFEIKLNIFPDSVIKGKDEYGYIWMEKDFNWVDIEKKGVSIGNPGDNNKSYGQFHFPFQFPFYENSFDSLFICENGWMSFSSKRTNEENKILPYPYGPFNLVAPFWNDFKLTDTSKIYLFSNSDSLVISYHKIKRRISGGSYSFQAILTSNGEITFQYIALDGVTDSCTVGIQNQDGSFGLNLTYNQPFLEDSTSFCIKPGWISVFPRKGRVEAGEGENLEARFISSCLPKGKYQGEFVVLYEDKNHQPDSTLIPLVLEVDTTSSVNPDESPIPQEFILEQNYPNPFNSSTNIRYYVGDRKPLPLSLKIYNLKGELVRNLSDISNTRGEHCITWDGKDNFNREVASGVYFYRLKIGNLCQTKKMVLVK